jgi:solute carrier family 35 protein E3
MKALPIRSVLLLSLSFCGFVVLTNLSLRTNSVAFYQMAKVLTTPFVGLIQHFVYGIGMRWSVRVTLGVACIGVLLATYEEVRVSVLGTTLALASVCVTAVYQVLVGAKQKELEANSMQLLAYQAPISAVLLLLACPFLESSKEIIGFRYSPALLFNILLSSLLAAMVNVSTFLIIGHTSAITYNVVGHCKLSLILLFGFVFFDDARMGLVNLAGVAVALAGILAYSFIVIYRK